MFLLQVVLTSSSKFAFLQSSTDRAFSSYRLMMDLPWKKKPALPRLATHFPTASKSDPALTLLPRNSNELRARPRPERPLNPPSPYPDRDERFENIPPPIVRYAPDPKILYITKEPEDLAEAKKRPQYYEDLFATRAAHNTPQDRVTQDSVVVVELKTNCKVNDDQQRLVGDLIFRIAQIFQRPETCIMLTLQREAGVFFGGTAEPSYLLKIYALPPLIAPVTNLRNTSLIQLALLDLLHIPFSHGVIIYTAVPEENLATNGSTARGEITRRERSESDESPNIFKTISRSMSRRLKTSSGQSVPISLPSTVGTAGASSSPQTEIHHSPTIMEDAALSPQEEGRRSPRKRMSLRNIVRRRFMEITSTPKDTVEEEEAKEKDDGSPKRGKGETEELLEEERAEEERAEEEQVKENK